MERGLEVLVELLCFLIIDKFHIVEFERRLLYRGVRKDAVVFRVVNTAFGVFT